MAAASEYSPPVTVGNNVSIGHGAVIKGATIGDYALIGINAVVSEGAKVRGSSSWRRRWRALRTGSRRRGGGNAGATGMPSDQSTNGQQREQGGTDRREARGGRRRAVVHRSGAIRRRTPGAAQARVGVTLWRRPSRLCLGMCVCVCAGGRAQHRGGGRVRGGGAAHPRRRGEGCASGGGPEGLCGSVLRPLLRRRRGGGAAASWRWRASCTSDEGAPGTAQLRREPNEGQGPAGAEDAPWAAWSRARARSGPTVRARGQQRRS